MVSICTPTETNNTCTYAVDPSALFPRLALKTLRDDEIARESVSLRWPKSWMSHRIVLPCWSPCDGKEYLDHGDLFPVRKQLQLSPLLRFLDTKEGFRRLKLWEVGKPKAGLPLPVSQDIRYYSSDCKERAGAWLFSILGLLMIVGPAWGLAYIPSKAWRLALSTCFAILFFGLVGIASTAKPQEAMAAAAT